MVCKDFPSVSVIEVDQFVTPNTGPLVATTLPGKHSESNNIISCVVMKLSTVREDSEKHPLVRYMRANSASDNVAC